VTGGVWGYCTVGVRSVAAIDRITADLRPIGLAEDRPLFKVPVAPEYDVDFHLPQDAPAGRVTITFTGVDRSGRIETISAPLDLPPR
jgi:hypothetical protein